MIFIIRALSHVRKQKKRERPNKKRDGPKKERGAKKKRKIKAPPKKERRDNATILFHTCASK